MLYRTVPGEKGSQFDIEASAYRSLRLIRAGDERGISLHLTTVRAGTHQSICYDHHLESVYCVRGEGVLRCAAGHFALMPGVVYAPERGERHEVDAKTEIEMICVFVPGLAGDEIHDDRGGYGPVKDA